MLKLFDLLKCCAPNEKDEDKDEDKFEIKSKEDIKNSIILTEYKIDVETNIRNE